MLERVLDVGDDEANVAVVHKTRWIPGRERGPAKTRREAPPNVSPVAAYRIAAGAPNAISTRKPLILRRSTLI